MKTLDSYVCGTHRKYDLGCRCEKCVSFIRKYKSEWALKNIEKKRKSAKNWAQRNKEKNSKYGKEYYLKTIEDQRLRGKLYRELNPQKSNERQRKRRANKKSVEFEKYTEEQVLNLYGKICYLCKKEIDLNASRWIGRGNWQNGLHIDHVIPIAKGGPDKLENVRPTHALCNIKKGDRLNG